jgi:hypothetical protein
MRQRPRSNGHSPDRVEHWIEPAEPQILLGTFQVACEAARRLGAGPCSRRGRSGHPFVHERLLALLGEGIDRPCA